MADLGHQLTEKELAKLEKRIEDEYARALIDMEEKLTEYLEQDEAARLIQEQLLEQGEITLKEYQDWCFRHEMMGKRWTDMKNVLAEDLLHTDEIALGIARDAMPGIFALNANYAMYQLEHDAKIITAFTLYNHDTAAYLLKGLRQLMPGPSTKLAQQIARNKALRWNKQKIQSAVLQGILQGDGTLGTAKRLVDVLQISKNSAIRYAKTMTTSAQNAGRYESFRRARDLGVQLVVEWQATLDHVTRHEHRQMHGQRREVDEPFILTEGGKTYEILYPADCTGTSNAPQSQIWNCRCTILGKVKGFESDTVKYSPKMGNMTYEEWLREKVT